MNLPFDYTKALYRRNNYNQPCVWFATTNGDSEIVVYHGILGNKIITDFIPVGYKKAIDEINSRFKSKHKSGYLLLAEIRDNTTLPVEESLLTYLNSYLPLVRINTNTGAMLPMLAKVYDNTNNKLFKKGIIYVGQFKINGLRCFISAETSTDLFNPIHLKFQSREGIYWNSLKNLEEYLLTILDKELLDAMVEEHYVLDGELYYPGASVNEINHYVKDNTCIENSKLQYWCYDIAIEDTIYSDRLLKFDYYFASCMSAIVNKEQHFNNDRRFVPLVPITVSNDKEAIIARDNFIEIGFEGLILRNPNAEYQYGKRNSSMIKFKRATDGKFKVINIYPEGTKRSHLPLLLCQNDINNETFECKLSAPQSYQTFVLDNKHLYIGKEVYMEYGERSGVTQCPFHIKGVRFID